MRRIIWTKDELDVSSMFKEYMCGWICSIVNIVDVDVVNIKLMLIYASGNIKYDLVLIRVKCYNIGKHETLKLETVYLCECIFKMLIRNEE